MENVSGLMIKEKLRLCQLAEIDPAEIIVPFNNDEIDKLWEESEPWQRTCRILYLERLTTTIPKAR